MDYRSRVLALVQSSALLPSQVSKALGVDSLMAGAMLSEMVSKGLLKVSRLKVGSSPVYYAPERVSQLLDFVSVLNEKDKLAVELLQKEGIVRDADQPALMRACLASVRDFAQPLKVVYEGKEELFWKWFLLSDADAELKIRAIIDPASVKGVSEGNAEPLSGKDVGCVQGTLQQEQVPVRKEKRAVSRKSEKKVSDFVSLAESFFSDNGISVVEKSVVRKDDVDFVVALPSAVGSLLYFCKAKGKKRVGDSDLSGALVSGQLRKLPVLFLFSGELSKSARELLPQLKGFVAKRL